MFVTRIDRNLLSQIYSRGQLCRKSRTINLLFGATVLLLITANVLAEEVINDSALWSGGLVLFENVDSLDYSVEYQLRLDDHMQSFSNHFVEFMGYNKVGANLLLNGGFRYTRRTDHNEGRIYFGGFFDLTRTSRGIQIRPDQFRTTLQIGYQRDFNTSFDDQTVDSNSIRWILVTSKPATPKLTPFLLAGLLTTWNPAYSFGVDKIRLGGGVAYHATARSRLRMQYIWEEARFRTPKKRTNIIWLRYEVILGNQ